MRMANGGTQTIEECQFVAFDLETTGIRSARDHIVEIAVPFALLRLEVDRPIHFYVELLENRQSRDRAPREGTIHLTCPSADFEQIMWDV